MARKPHTWPEWDRDESARLVGSRALRVRELESTIERELVRSMVTELQARGVGGTPCQRT